MFDEALQASLISNFSSPLEQLSESNIIGITFSRQDGQIIAANDEFLRIVGYTREDVEAGLLNWTGLTPPEWAATDQQATANFAAGGKMSRFEQEYLHKDGTRVPVLVGVVALHGAGPEWLAFIVDISQRAIGQLAGRIAHDFNNLLTVILGYSALLEEKLSEDPLLKNVVEVRKAGERAALLTQQLLAFSRQQVLRPRVVAINQLIEGMEAVLRRIIGEDIDLAGSLDPEAGNIKADPGQIEQVLMNLSINARDAMLSGGHLLIETKRQYVDGSDAALRSLPPGFYLALAVTDTGCGMDAETKRRIFEPFFTTKDPGVGTGLGLSTVLGIINQSGGSISVHSELGVGTTFRAYLPLVEEAATAIEPGLLNPAPSGGETILVVEDDASIRSLAAGVLRGHGYEVLEAGHAAEAIAACELCPPVSLLLTDVLINGMSGNELAHLLLPSHPGLQVLYMSGYTEMDVVQRGIVQPGAKFLQKPFRPGELLRRVGEMLSQRARSSKILVVDDDIQVRSFIAALLQGEGYIVIDASDGKEAQTRCEQGEIDLMITDLVMPEQEGLETIHAIRHRWPKIPIIAVSGAFGGSYLGLAKKLGAEAVIRKPFEPDDLLNEVRRLCQLSRDARVSC